MINFLPVYSGDSLHENNLNSIHIKYSDIKTAVDIIKAG